MQIEMDRQRLFFFLTVVNCPDHVRARCAGKVYDASQQTDCDRSYKLPTRFTDKLFTADILFKQKGCDESFPPGQILCSA